MSALPNSKVDNRRRDTSVCRNCGQPKQGRCKPCLRAYKRANAARLLPQLREQAKRHRRAHPEKALARQRTHDAIKAGRLIPQPCEVCGTSENVEAHHADYSKPLEVRWMCKPCHVAHHLAERNAPTAPAPADPTGGRCASAPFAALSPRALAMQEARRR